MPGQLMAGMQLAGQQAGVTPQSIQLQTNFPQIAGPRPSIVPLHSTKPPTTGTAAPPAMTNMVAKTSAPGGASTVVTTTPGGIPATATAMLSADGTILLLPSGGQAGNLVLDANSLPMLNLQGQQAAGKKGAKKPGQRTLMPKPPGFPISSMPVMTSMPLSGMWNPPMFMPTQSDVSNSPSTPDLVEKTPTCSAAAVLAGQAKALVTAPLMVSVATDNGGTITATSASSGQSNTTDILAKAAESIFATSLTDISPPISSFYNPANEDNPLHIDTSAIDAEHEPEGSTIQAPQNLPSPPKAAPQEPAAQADNNSETEKPVKSKKKKSKIKGKHKEKVDADEENAVTEITACHPVTLMGDSSILPAGSLPAPGRFVAPSTVAENMMNRAMGANSTPPQTAINLAAVSTTLAENIMNRVMLSTSQAQNIVISAQTASMVAQNVMKSNVAENGVNSGITTSAVNPCVVNSTVTQNVVTQSLTHNVTPNVMTQSLTHNVTPNVMTQSLTRNVTTTTASCNILTPNILNSIAANTKSVSNATAQQVADSIVTEVTIQQNKNKKASRSKKEKHVDSKSDNDACKSKVKTSVTSTKDANTKKSPNSAAEKSSEMTLPLSMPVVMPFSTAVPSAEPGVTLGASDSQGKDTPSYFDMPSLGIDSPPKPLETSATIEGAKVDQPKKKKKKSKKKKDKEKPGKDCVTPAPLTSVSAGITPVNLETNNSVVETTVVVASSSSPKKSKSSKKSKKVETNLNIPETITFTESELSQVLDQVENIGSLVQPEPVERKSKSRKNKSTEHAEGPESKKKKLGDVETAKCGSNCYTADILERAMKDIGPLDIDYEDESGGGPSIPEQSDTLPTLQMAEEKRPDSVDSTNDMIIETEGPPHIAPTRLKSASEKTDITKNQHNMSAQHNLPLLSNSQQPLVSNNPTQQSSKGTSIFDSISSMISTNSTITAEPSIHTVTTAASKVTMTTPMDAFSHNFGLLSSVTTATTESGSPNSNDSDSLFSTNFGLDLGAVANNPARHSNIATIARGITPTKHAVSSQKHTTSSAHKTATVQHPPVTAECKPAQPTISMAEVKKDIKKNEREKGLANAGDSKSICNPLILEKDTLRKEPVRSFDSLLANREKIAKLPQSSFKPISNEGESFRKDTFNYAVGEHLSKEEPISVNPPPSQKDNTTNRPTEHAQKSTNQLSPHKSSVSPYSNQQPVGHMTSPQNKSPANQMQGHKQSSPSNQSQVNRQPSNHRPTPNQSYPTNQMQPPLQQTNQMPPHNKAIPPANQMAGHNQTRVSPGNHKEMNMAKNGSEPRRSSLHAETPGDILSPSLSSEPRTPSLHIDSSFSPSSGFSGGLFSPTSSMGKSQQSRPPSSSRTFDSQPPPLHMTSPPKLPMPSMERKNEPQVQISKKTSTMSNVKLHQQPVQHSYSVENFAPSSRGSANQAKSSNVNTSSSASTPTESSCSVQQSRGLEAFAFPPFGMPNAPPGGGPTNQHNFMPPFTLPTTTGTSTFSFTLSASKNTSTTSSSSMYAHQMGQQFPFYGLHPHGPQQPGPLHHPQGPHHSPSLNLPNFHIGAQGQEVRVHSGGGPTNSQPVRAMHDRLMSPHQHRPSAPGSYMRADGTPQHANSSSGQFGDPHNTSMLSHEKERTANTGAPTHSPMASGNVQHGRNGPMGRSPHPNNDMPGFFPGANFPVPPGGQSSNQANSQPGGTMPTPPLRHPQRPSEQQVNNQQRRVSYDQLPPNQQFVPNFNSPGFEPPPLQFSRDNLPPAQPENFSSNQSIAMQKSANQQRVQESRSKSMSSSKPQKSSRSKQQSKKARHQYEVDTNLQNSIFESGRSMTPMFPVPALSPPPRNMQSDAPTYLPTNLFGNTSRPLSNSNPLQHKNPPEINSPFNPLFGPGRPQNGIGLNFQPGFGMNPAAVHANVPPSNPMTSHSNPLSHHVPNFNLSNLFPDVNNSPQGDSLNLSPMKFAHGNPILPPQPGIDHNPLQHHHQAAGPMYHNHRGHHPPAVIHSAMSINNILGHNPHGFEARPMAPMGPGGTMAPPFGSHGHAASFGMPLNFPIHDGHH